jgi:phosphonate transport system substrate-binding protein
MADGARRGAALAAEAAALPALSGEQSALALEQAQSVTPPAADWRRELGVFKAGLVRGWSADMSPAIIARLEAALADTLGLPARVVVFERFASLIEAQERGAIDYAVYSSRAYAAAQLACECVDVLVQPTSLSGASGQRARLHGDPAVLAATASAKPLRIGRVAAGGLAGDTMARGVLRIGGTRVRGDEAFWVDFPDTGAAAAAYDAGSLDAYLDVAMESGPEPALRTHQGSRRASTLWMSEYWPFGPHAVREALAPEPKRLLAAFLTGLDLRDPPLHALLSDGLPGPFRPVDADAFRAVRRSVQMAAGDG